ncbi:hypothetical protein [Helicobacter sp. 13S00477-4]|uniref:hypothetical protein n=1 Tax=Helicobacter sp. 13S00477-4 TaxID=1905759 RepID=UPI000BA6736A|nr:hypothetical protein [Helicobacter sp. 13S00477-4]PAF52479.1 hypothetical protein BKH44_01475 [Helicobacter sp. 13S00477-4]
MKKNLLLYLAICPFLLGAPANKESKFPNHIDKCIDGYLYRVFIDENNKIIPSSIHQVLEKSALHHKMLPKSCSKIPKSK